MTILRRNYYRRVIIKGRVVIIVSLWITEVFHNFKHLPAGVLWTSVDNHGENAKIPAFPNKNGVWITVDKFAENWG